MGIFCNLFRSSRRVSSDTRFSKAFSVILPILFSENFNICSGLIENEPFPMRGILFFDKSNINNDSSPTNVSAGI